MGFLGEVRDRAEELGEKAGAVFEAAKDKAGDRSTPARTRPVISSQPPRRLDTLDDGDIDSGDASNAFGTATDKVSGVIGDLKDKVTGGGDSPADQVADAATTVVTVSDAAGDGTDSATAAKDQALADVQAKAEDLKSDNA